MKITSVTIYHIQAPLKSPFRASYGVYEQRESLLLEVQEESGVSGWGEVVAFSQPWYTEETVKTTYQILKDYLIPIVLQQPYSHPTEFIKQCSWIKRNNMAKAGLEGALWDLYAKLQQKPLYQVFGGQRNCVDVGVVIGLNEPSQMMKQIEQYIEKGYKRFKIKISPKMDYALVKEIRTTFPTLPLMVDANSAYQLEDVNKLKALDEFQLMMIEQPFGYFDFIDHAQLQQQMETPICLDESICSLDDVKTAHALGSCKVVNIKSGRVGGLGEAIKIHDYCQSVNIPVWCGGMLEFGVSRLQNLAIATLPNFIIPADLSASSRYYAQDVIIPVVMVENGQVTLSDEPGIGAEINKHVLKKICMYQETSK